MTIEEAIKYVEDINKTVTWQDDQKEDESFFESVFELLEELKYLRECTPNDYRAMEEYILSKQYQQGRADAIDELLKAITEKSYKIEEDYTVGEFARVCIWEDDLQKIAEQLKEQKNE